jgi:hypothetical protein
MKKKKKIFDQSEGERNEKEQSVASLVEDRTLPAGRFLLLFAPQTPVVHSLLQPQSFLSGFLRFKRRGISRIEEHLGIIDILHTALGSADLSNWTSSRSAFKRS